MKCKNCGKDLWEHTYSGISWCCKEPYRGKIYKEVEPVSSPKEELVICPEPSDCPRTGCEHRNPHTHSKECEPPYDCMGRGQVIKRCVPYSEPSPVEAKIKLPKTHKCRFYVKNERCSFPNADLNDLGVCEKTEEVRCLGFETAVSEEYLQAILSRLPSEQEIEPYVEELRQRILCYGKDADVSYFATAIHKQMVEALKGEA